ncbi:MAG: hypothetical protein JO323_07700 [Acidobacteriia bacterium]|nr:hypothetical protein [Terriglobia bacterium]
MTAGLFPNLLVYGAGLLPLLPVMPAARAADSQNRVPDLNGVWAPYRAGRGGDAKFAPPPAETPVLKPEYAKPYEAKRASEAASLARGEQLPNGSVRCVPYGVPTMMSVASYPVEFIQTPRQVTMIAEAFSEVRRVYLDRPQSKIEDVAPGYYGRSVGHWDGDTLVVDTVGIKSSVAGYRGLPHSDQMRITERIRLASPDILQDQITIADPVVLEKAFTYTLVYKRNPDYEMVEFVCDNNREYVDDKGVVRMKVHEQ